MSRFRRACFTSFEEDKPVYDDRLMNYMIFEKEICPTTGKEHWQGYVEFHEQLGFKRIKKILGNEVHIEKAKGNANHSYIYCTKDGEYEEYGNPKEQGKRSDLMAVAEEVRNGGTIFDIAVNYPVQFIKFHRGIDRLMSVRDKIMRRKEREIKVIVLIGPPGCGKTRKAYDFDKDLYKLIPDGNLWFDGYDGEKTLLIDEMSTNKLSYNMMLAICDRYELRLPIKGSFTYANWETIYITSNKEIRKWWPDEFDTNAFERRVNEVITHSEQNCSEVAGNTIPPLMGEDERDWRKEFIEMKKKRRSKSEK